MHICFRATSQTLALRVLRPSSIRFALRQQGRVWAFNQSDASFSTSHKMVAATTSKMEEKSSQVDGKAKRLILCFDGTGNSFQGNPTDTNIVKLLDFIDHKSPRQKIYYQPGIGTYTADGSVNRNLVSRISANISQTIDTGLATTFDQHVMAGYRFLMRYYEPGDMIYVFGFSRGAFTARYLSSMVSHLGLLSSGNEEMVPFAYKVYQDAYLEGDPPPEDLDEKTATAHLQKKREALKEALKAQEGINQYSNGTPATGNSKEPAQKTTLKGRPANALMLTFRKTFCTHNQNQNQPDEGDSVTGADSAADENVDTNPFAGVKVHFLGLFDTVSSVGTFDTTKTNKKGLPSVAGTARHIRHAVAIDEHRVKFKADLLLGEKFLNLDGDTIKEVWFPGNHCDIGGGYAPEYEMAKDCRGWLIRTVETIGRFFGRKTPPAIDAKVKDLKSTDTSEASLNKKDDLYQLSDIPLKWMIDEIDRIPFDARQTKLTWNLESKDGYIKRFKNKRSEAIKMLMHDTMNTAGKGTRPMIYLWKFMEWLPVIKRWEYRGFTAADRKNMGEKLQKINGQIVEYNNDLKKLKTQSPGLESMKEMEPPLGKWDFTSLPPNRGGSRDIPPEAVFHASVIERFLNFPRSVERKVHKTIHSWQPLNDINTVEGKQLRDAGNYLNQVIGGTGPTNKSQPSNEHDLVRFVPNDTEPEECTDHTFALASGSYKSAELDYIRSRYEPPAKERPMGVND